MGLPKQKYIELPLLFEIQKAGGSAKPKDLYDKVRLHFPRITDIDLGATVSTGQLKWQNTMQFARNECVKKGEIDRSIRNVWALTEKGHSDFAKSGHLGPQMMFNTARRGTTARQGLARNMRACHRHLPLQTCSCGGVWRL